MKVQFTDTRTGAELALCRTCSDFMAFAVNVSLRDRPFIVGKPYRNAFVTVLFQSSWLGKINPFWVKLFKCKGAEITLDEARGLFKPQLLIPLDRRPSQNRDKFETGARNPWSRRQKSARPLRSSNVKGSNDYSRVGTASYVGQYASWGLYTTSHQVAVRQTIESSVKTPGFKSIKKIDRPWNNYSYTVSVGNEASGTYGYSTPGSYVQASGYLRGGTYQGLRIIDLWPYTVYSNKTANAALTKALSRAKSMSVNLGQTYAERKQTVGLVTKSLNRLLSLALALKKGDVKHARRLINGFQGKDRYTAVPVFNSTGTHIIGRRYVHIRKSHRPKVEKKTFADLWLEFQYGWRPLLSDIYGSCELIANTYHLAKPMRVSAKVDLNKVTSFSTIGGKERIQLDVEDRSRVLLEFLEPSEWTNFMSKTGIGNPALLAWELVPFSFVVDWAIPVGTYLNNLDALTGLNFRRMSTTTTTHVTLSSTMMNWKSGAYTHTYSGGDLSLKQGKKSRVISYTPPLPPLPSFSPSMGVERSLSAISLLTQIFSRGKTSMK